MTVDFKMGGSITRRAIGWTMFLLLFSTPALAQFFSRQEVSHTSYDLYLDSFRSVASQASGAGPLTLDLVREWTEKANDIPYNHVEPYRFRSPEEVEASGYGDCKDKALWLYSKLSAAGARHIQLVIGRKDTQAGEFHAWLYLTFCGRTYLLDPTISGSISEASDYSADEYVPVYAYDRSGAYAYATEGDGSTLAINYQMAVPRIAGH